MANRLARGVRRTEDALVFLAVFALAVLLIAEAAARKVFNTGIRNSGVYIEHLVLVAAFAAAAVASREKRHLALASGMFLPERTRRIADTVTAALAAALTLTFGLCSLSFARNAFAATERVGFLPKRLVVLVMAAGFLAMSARFVAGIGRRRARAVAAAGAAALGLFLGFEPLVGLLTAGGAKAMPGLAAAAAFLKPLAAGAAGPLIAVLVVAAFFGLPIFAVLGGIGVLLFVRGGLPLEIVPNQAYGVLTGGAIPAIPLFAAVGFFLSESRAGERMVRFFQAAFGWFPGGLTVMAVIVCAFFTTFTGASGVTILALGGLLGVILEKAGYPKRFTVGLLTASGSIGLLLPPSLPVIIYGVTAQASIRDMFVGGLLPGAFLVVSVIAVGIVYSWKHGLPRHPLRVREALTALRGSFWELLLPFLVFGLYFGGLASLQESAAIALLYVWIVETFIKKDLRVRDLPRILLKAAPIIGGVLIIMALANGLSYYIIDAQIPQRLSDKVAATISSPVVFLLLLNLALLVVGCFMDIYSAILVVVPLIIPLGILFRIHPVHLGIIFLANLELGYLTPPVGLNLYLACYRFEEPIGRVYRDVLVFLAIELAAVLLITYVPFLTTALL
ncbi:MAG TPA: TRAP transporter large permease subunit [Candidatus Aminicenantes bacterium]|nr:TRAP transporter large permease subunit [Candidatus Aminicenantes bacterium]HRY64519.1 TRAP transporter large permease subunit [Candidatus Aminicenantes bacterium]HRZ71432.1 TRAP transporter large permease subunit [Candidatus Aminicenantes bacterium]